MEKSDEVFEGVWWIPGQEKRYAGTLTLDDIFELNLIDDKQNMYSLLKGEGLGTNILVGQSLSKSITLLGCKNVGAQTAIPGIAQHLRIRVTTALIGDHFASEKESRFDLVEFRLSNLDEWVARPAIQGAISAKKHQLTYEPLKVLSTEIPRGTIELTNHFEHSRPTPWEIVWRSKETLRLILKKPLDLSEISFKYLSPMRQLLTLASGTHTATLSLRVANSKKLDYSGNPIWSLVRQYNGRQSLPDPKRVRSAEMRFTLQDSRTDFATVIPKWMRLSKRLGPDLDLLFSLNRPDQLYLWDSLFTVATATEGMHRRINPRSPANTTFRTRLIWLLTYTSPLIDQFVGDKAKWATLVKEQRNVVAHSLPAPEITSEQLFRLMQTTQLLLHLVLLRKLGFTKKQCKIIVMNDSNWRFLLGVMPETFPELFS